MPSYLDPIHTGAGDEWNPSDYAYHLTRRARGLALWYSLVVNGTEAYSGAVDAALSMAQVTARLITEERSAGIGPRAGPVHRAVPAERVGGRGLQRWSASLLDEQIAFVTPTKWEGETVARLIFLHPGTTEEIVREVLGTIA